MAYLLTVLGFIATAAFVYGIAWVVRAIRASEADDYLQPIDYGALEGELTHYVHANLNKVKL